MTHLGGAGLSGQAEGTLETLLVLVVDLALGDADAEPLLDHGNGHAVPVLHLLTGEAGEKHRVVDTFLIGVWEQNLDLTNEVSMRRWAKLVNPSADDLLHHGDQGGDLVADVSIVTLGGGGIARTGRGVGGGLRLTKLEVIEIHQIIDRWNKDSHKTHHC